MNALASLTQADIKNGELDQLLSNAGIYNVQQYVKDFHQQTEHFIIQDYYKTFDGDDVTGNERTDFRTDAHGLMDGLRPCVTNSTEFSISSHGSSDIQGDTAATGVLDAWIKNWLESRNERPEPQSLSDWIQSLTPKTANESNEKVDTQNKRLECYFSAAEKVLSKRGYNVSSNSIPVTNTSAKVGFAGNVKDMYFLWKKYDKNNDREITVQDFEILLQEMGLGFLSKPLAQTLFNIIDTNHDGKLQFRDFVALISIIKELYRGISSIKSVT